MKQYWTIACFLLFCSLGFTQVTFSEDIADIIYNNCTNCHRTGEIGPMPFTNYEEVKDWGTMIKYVTEIGYMPPWSPNPEYKHLLNERVLTDEQKSKISSWVDNGMPQGNPQNEPDLPAFPTGSQIGSPDVVLQMAQSHTVIGDNKDEYYVFVLPTDFTEDKEIACIEFRPDNKRAVHHVLIGYDVTGQAAARDAQTPEYGYSSFGDFGVAGAEFLSWTYVPGDMPLVFPEGIGEVIPAGADLLIQVHYAPLPTDEVDKSSVNIFFKGEDDSIERPVITGWVLPNNLPGGFASFILPPNEVTEFTALNFDGWSSSGSGVNYDVSLVSVQPHGHLLAKAFEVFAVTPQNDTINIVQIPEYDFNWQGAYTMPKLLPVPANSTWYTKAVYDNTVDNPYNPSNPPKFAFWGEGTEDEMLVNFFNFVVYQEGDENVVLGENILNSSIEVGALQNSTLFAPHPNPSDGNFSLSFHLESDMEIEISLRDLQGRMIQSLKPKMSYENGFHEVEISTMNLNSGVYLVELRSSFDQIQQKIVIR